MFLYILAFLPSISHEDGESDIQSSRVLGRNQIKNLLLRETVLSKFMAT